MPVHRIPVAKRGREKQALDRYVEQGVIIKVHEPTAWCSNELIRETPKKFGVCIDPTQTVNKAIHRPKHQMPTLNEKLHKLSAAKCFSLADVKDGFLQAFATRSDFSSDQGGTSTNVAKEHLSYFNSRICRTYNKPSRPNIQVIYN